MTEQEIKPHDEQDSQPVQELPQQLNHDSPLKKKIDNIREEYKRLFLGIGMLLMLIYSIYLLYNTFVK